MTGAEPGRLTDPQLYQAGDPFALYTDLRRSAPVAWVEAQGFWAVTTHPEVAAIGTDPGLFCSSRGILTDEIGTVYESPPTMMHTDPPQHTRYRRILQPFFSPRRIASWEPVIRGLAGELVVLLVLLRLDELVDPVGIAVAVVRRLPRPAHRVDQQAGHVQLLR